jgi:DNA-binding transcriptional LysR family regulator
MDMTFLRSLIAVVDAGAITGASERIHVTQPALSRRIRQMEAYFQADLLIRGQKGVTLTEIGRLVVAEGRVLVSRYDQLRAQVASLQGLEGGTVRIGGGATAVSFILPEAIAVFQRRFPGIRFHLKEAGSAEIARDVATGSLELGVVTLPVSPRDLDIHELRSDRIVLAAPAGHELAARAPVPVEDLGGYSFVGFEGGSAIRQLIDAALRDAGIETEVVMELRSIPAILRMVATTGNLAFVSSLGLEGQSAVVEIPVRDLRIERALAVVTGRGAHLSPAAQAFSTALRGT